MEGRSVLINSPFITLGRLLKEKRIIPTDGVTEWFLEEDAVLVNDEPDDRRGCKLYPEDKVQIPDHQLLVIKGK